MRYILKIITFCIFLAALQPMSADAQQKCKNSIRENTPDSDFTFHDEGTATNKTTGLMWMRCALGMQWEGKDCSGTAGTFTWTEGLKSASLHEFAGYNDWRLPNKNELVSIVEERCVSPAINAKVFPQTPLMFHWSSTPYASLKTGAWSVDFGYGVVTATEKDSKLPVRLVRDPE
jgi:hypothetical protein